VELPRDSTIPAGSSIASHFEVRNLQDPAMCLLQVARRIEGSGLEQSEGGQRWLATAFGIIEAVTQSSRNPTGR
jgi:hypothetical protein